MTTTTRTNEGKTMVYKTFPIAFLNPFLWIHHPSYPYALKFSAIHFISPSVVARSRSFLFSTNSSYIHIAWHGMAWPELRQKHMHCLTGLYSTLVYIVHLLPAWGSNKVSYGWLGTIFNAYINSYGSPPSFPTPPINHNVTFDMVDERKPKAVHHQTSIINNSTCHNPAQLLQLSNHTLEPIQIQTHTLSSSSFYPQCVYIKIHSEKNSNESQTCFPTELLWL